MFIKIGSWYLFLNLIGIRVLSLNNYFAKCFSKSDLVLLCPLYAAGERKNSKFSQVKFAKLISKLSKTRVILIYSQYQLGQYLKKNLIKDEIIIGMGAGIISKWMNDLKNIIWILMNY